MSLKIEEKPKPEKCPICGSVKVYRIRLVPRKKLGVLSRRWVCGSCGSSFY